MDRRNFLGRLAAISVVGTLGTIHTGELLAATKTSGKGKRKASGKFDDNLVVLISDTHINPDGYQPQKCRKVIDEVLAMNPLPRNVVTFGDLAYLTGKKDEYALAKEIFQPLEDAGITVTHGMGNHDRRENFREYFPEKAEATKLSGRMVFIVQTPRADIIMLDSLQEGDDTSKWITPGALDEEQVEWLKNTLDNYHKPVFVASHHPIKELGIAPILAASSCCSGYIHGHDHRWRCDWFKLKYGNNRIVRTLCLPSTGHWGDIGYTTLHLEEDCAVAKLHQSDFFFSTPLKEGEEMPGQWKMILEEHKDARCGFAYSK